MAFADKAVGRDFSATGFAVGNPLAIPSIEGHWRASNTALGAVSSFVDRSKKLRHITQATGSLQPVNTASQIGTQPALIFDGTDDYMEILNMVIPQPWEFWILMKRITFSSGDFYFEMGNSTLSTYAQDQAATNLRFLSGSTTFNVTVGAAGSWFLLRFRSVAGASNSSVTLNNGTPATGTMTNGIQRLTLAAKVGGTLTPNIAIADMFIVSSALTAGEATMANAYFRKRYPSLALP